MSTVEEHLGQSFVIFDINNPPPRQSYDLECRICLEPVNLTDETTISPCRCIGSVANVHFKCLSEWISKNHKAPLSEAPTVDHFTCEMCKYDIQFQTQKHLECLSFAQCSDNCKRNKLLLVILLLLSLSFLLLLIFSIVVVIQNNLITFIGGGWFQSMLIISSLIIVLTVQLFSTYFLMAKFFVNRTAKIVKIGGEAKSRNRSQSTCTSQANLITIDRRIINSQFAPMDIIPENLPA